VGYCWGKAKSIILPLECSAPRRQRLMPEVPTQWFMALKCWLCARLKASVGRKTFVSCTLRKLPLGRVFACPFRSNFRFQRILSVLPKKKGELLPHRLVTAPSER